MRSKNRSGFTLIEIIVAVAILGILVSMFLSAFYSGAAGVIFSGQKSRELMNLQSVIDELNQVAFTNRSDIDTYLGTTKGFHAVTDQTQVSVLVSGEQVNYYLSGEETKAGVKGYTVTIVQFIDSGKRSARLSTFIITRGT